MTGLAGLLSLMSREAKRSQAGRGSQKPRTDREEPEKVLGHLQHPLHTDSKPGEASDSVFWQEVSRCYQRTVLNSDWPCLKGTAFRVTASSSK